MFERFTDRARAVVVLAQEEARLLNHNYIGTEHILLGLSREESGVARKVLDDVGIELATVRDDVLGIIGRGQSPPGGHIPFTPRAKKVLELSLREALQLGHNYIGTEHILLALVREGEGVAAQVLVKNGVNLHDLRARTISVLQAYTSEQVVGAESVPAPSRRRRKQPKNVPSGPRCPSCEESLLAHARYRVVPVAEQGGSGRAEVLFLFCSNCGELLDDMIVPGDDD